MLRLTSIQTTLVCCRTPAIIKQQHNGTAFNKSGFCVVFVVGGFFGVWFFFSNTWIFLKLKSSPMKQKAEAWKSKRRFYHSKKATIPAFQATASWKLMHLWILGAKKAYKNLQKIFVFGGIWNVLLWVSGECQMKRQWRKAGQGRWI